jgi:GNAT superfamily N-acetyltransferase
MTALDKDALIIRGAQAEDYGQWRPLWDQYNAFYGRSGPTALPEENIQTTWDRFLDPAEDMHCLLAQHQDRLVGLAHLIYHRNTITIEPTCYLQDLYASPDLRGKGIGRALIQAFYDHARQAGTVGVYWHTQSNNHTAMRLYDQVATNTQFVVYRHNLPKDGTN